MNTASMSLCSTVVQSKWSCLDGRLTAFFFFGSTLEIKENLDEIVLSLLVVVCAVLRELLS